MARTHSRTIIRLSKPSVAPKANAFLKHYFALERPHTQHLMLTKGTIDFLLGMVIGVLIGLIIAAVIIQA
jgi:hypothetical protein